VPIRAHPVFTGFRVPVRRVFVVDEIVAVVVAQKDHVATPAAVAAVETAPRLVLLAAEAHGSATTVTGLDFDYTLVDEHGGEWCTKPTACQGGPFTKPEIARDRRKASHVRYFHDTPQPIRRAFVSSPHETP